MINENESNKEEDQRLILLKKAETFKEQKIIVHVKYKSGVWKRGLITLVTADFFFMQERLEGEVVVFFIEIRDIENFHDEKKEEQNGNL